MHAPTGPTFLAASTSENAGRPQRLAANIICISAGILTAFLLPFASRPGPVLPGFALINQTALLVAYAFSAWVLFRQFGRNRSLPICLIAAGTLYTTAIIFFQMISFPGIVPSGRLLGNGPETTTWLWTFWHLGPPVCALAYGLTVGWDKPRTVPAHLATGAFVLAVILALAAASLCAVIATFGLPWLPKQSVGDDYSALTTSGVGPVVQLLTVLALAVVWFRTRRRSTMLELWIAVSLFLLVCDNFLTMAGSARGTVGWYVGRLEALVSAFSILGAYLAEIDALRARAEEAAESIERAEAAMRQSQKMEAVGRLTGGIAHDFNNLLMIASSGFELIKRRPDDRTRVVKTAEAGLQTIERGARLTRQLLTFARRQALRPETVNPNALLLEFEALARRAVGEAIEIHLDLYPALHPAQIDGSEFETAVLNLIVNARDAVDAQNGRIKVTSRNAMRSPPLAAGAMDSLPAGEYVVIAVIDNGCGMDDITRAQAFEPFFTTKEFGKGSGLGLSQVYGFAQASGGAVEITSKPGRGTTVEIWLPRATQARKPASSPRHLSVASPIRRAEHGETVLAVEDEPEVLNAVVESLADLGYHVLAARDANEALERLRSEERIDILFSDIVMPGGMNGVQLAVEASRIRPGMRLVLTSGYTGEALTGDHNVPPDVSILTKPYRQHELAERLRAV